MYNVVKTIQKKITQQLLSPPDRNKKGKKIIGINIAILIAICVLFSIIVNNKYLNVHIMLIPILYGMVYINIGKSALVSIISVSIIGIVSIIKTVNPSQTLYFLWLYRVGIVTMGTLIISILIHQVRKFYKSAMIKSQTDVYTGQWNFLKLKEDYLKLTKTENFNGCTFVMYEIDNLDLTNRFEGYKEGWEAMKGLMERAAIGFEVQIVYTISQNRYLVMIPNTPLDIVISKADNFYEASRHPFHIYDIAIYLNIKIGIAHMTSLEGNLYEVFRRLGSALEQTEKSNKQVILYDEEFTTKRKENYQLQLALNNACRNHEFYLHYQPKVYVHDESVEGVEALLRWDNIPNGVSIAQIIDIAEETGLITEITRQVVLKAICQLSEWKKQGRKISIAVNLSSKDLRDETIVDYISEKIKEYDVNPGLFEIEMTERHMVEDEVKVSSLLNKMRSLGIKVSLDDYGTGHNSMMYLIHMAFRFDYIKIDKLFIDKIMEPNTKALMKGVITAAHGGGSKIIAEGVERTEQRDLLREIGCDIIQGYYYSKPLMPKDVERYMTGAEAL